MRAVHCYCAVVELGYSLAELAKVRTLDPVEVISAQLRCNIKPFELIVAF